MKYLVVDDNDEFREYLCKYIVTQNDECIELDDGLNVKTVFESFNPDWVLMDLQMKSIHGFEAAKDLIEKYPEAKLIFVSNYTDKHFQKKAQFVGAVALISKENLEEVYKIVHKN